MKNLKITKGECNPTQLTGCGSYFIDVGIDCIGTVWVGKEQDANAELIKDAFNTANKCGKLPSDLLAERDELLHELRKVRLDIKLNGVWREDSPIVQGIDRAINKTL